MNLRMNGFMLVRNASLNTIWYQVFQLAVRVRHAVLAPMKVMGVCVT
jgi:hypothetical protein